ncbi:MAG: sulfatase-like hydrolase/transferase, partial [Lacipirellulaceae bacterium]
ASEVTLAEALKTGGYDTAFFGKWHIGQSGNPGTTPLAHGFNSNVGGTASGNPGFAGGFFAGSDGAWAGMPGLDTPGTYPSSKYLSDALAEKASDYITQSQQGGSPAPFFLTMSHYLVHTPLQAPASLVSKYQTKINTLEQQNVDLKGHNNATYAAMVEKMDESLGMLVSRLEDPNADGNTSDSIRDNTIILFTSDHGGLDTSETFATDNAPLRAGKGSLYEGGTRVPLVVSWTGNSAINSGLASTARSSSHDIYPTLLDLTGVAGDATQNANMDGTSFRAALEGGSFDRGHQFWHYPHTSPQDSGSDIVSGGSFVSSVIKDNWKLIYFYDDPHYELYDLSSDLGESDSVLLANPQVANDLSAALRQHLVGINAQMPIDINTNNPVDAPPALDLNLAGPMFLERFNETVDYQVAGVG